jgi:hypothetical protein
MSILIYSERESIDGLIVCADDEDAIVLVVVLSCLVQSPATFLLHLLITTRQVYDILFYCYGLCLSAKTVSSILIP